MSRSIICLLLITEFASTALAAQEVEMPRIIKEGSTTDILTDDPVLPVKRKKNSGDSGAGNLGSQLQDEIPLNFTNYGTPGQSMQIRGLSSSAEHSDVTALGISLNPVVGGGFNFATLPQYLWSDYKFILMPTSSGFNPQTNGATVDLKLWTEQAMQANDFGARGTALAAGSGAYQYSAGLHDSGMAVLAGYSAGKVIGPSGSLSAQFVNESIFTPKVHLLASELDSKTPGSISFPTPLDHLKSTRLIPVAGLDTQLGKGAILKSSVVYDYSKLAYHTSTSDFENRSYQLGAENALWADGWRIGVSARQARFNGDNIFAPVENLGNVQVAKSFAIQNVTIDPVLQVVGVTQYGVHPQGSLGAKIEMDREWSIFSRVNYLNRFPSFQDRYFDDGSFKGNPNLKKERSKTATLGIEYDAGDLHQVLQGYAQWRADTSLSTTATVENMGDSRVYGLLSDSEVQFLSLLTLENNFAYASSYVDQTRRRYYYLPMFADTVSLKFHPESVPTKPEVTFSARFQGPVDTPESFGTSELLGGYSYFNAGIVSHLYTQGAMGLQAGFKVENIFDHRIQFVRNYPSEGRVLIGTLTGTF